MTQNLENQETLSPESASSASVTPTQAAEGPALGRYVILRGHAQGGLGEVFRAADTELGRTVALKRLQPPYASRTDLVRRFLIEAEVTAQLEHPGVVPVYGLVRDEAGQPSYAMRFIEGHTLGEAIKEFHAKPGSFTDKRLEFRGLLARLVAVCNTMAYVHKKGVIHRDLKPQNILLGEFGETLVVDWGMAKRLKPPGSTAPQAAIDAQLSTIAATLEVSPSPSPAFLGEDTQPGAVLGTPAYMSPEQAAGRMDVIGPTSDIYSLGATLYVLLTGQPPFEGGDWPRLQQQIQRGHFPRPREVKPKVPRALEAICLKAMAAEPTDRFASMSDLGQELERWLANEPVEAYREPLHWQLGRWARRHGRVLAMLAAMLVVGGVAWLNRRQELQAFEAYTANVLQRSQAYQEAGRLNEALATVKQTMYPLHMADSESVRRLQQQRTDLELVLNLAELRRKSVLELNLLDSHDRLGTLADQYRQVFQAAGLDLANLPTSEAAKRLDESPHRLALVEALDLWIFVLQIESYLNDKPSDKATWEKLLLLANAADPEPWRMKLRSCISEMNWKEAPNLAADAQAELRTPGRNPRLTPTHLAFLAWILDINGALNRKLDQNLATNILAQAIEKHPQEFLLHAQLGSLYLDRKLYEKARQHLLIAQALEPGQPRTLMPLATIHEQQGELDEAFKLAAGAYAAEKSITEALEMQARVRLKQQRPADAAALCQQYLASHASSAGVYGILGQAQMELGRPAEAEQSLKKALALDKNTSELEDKLFLAMLNQKRFQEAVSFIQGQKRPTWRGADWEMRYAEALLQVGKPDEAMAALGKAMLFRPGDPHLRVLVGDAYVAKEEFLKARLAYRMAVAMKSDYAPAHAGLGNVAVHLKEWGPAADAYEKACQCDPKNEAYHAQHQKAEAEAKAARGKEP